MKINYGTLVMACAAIGLIASALIRDGNKQILFTSLGMMLGVLGFWIRRRTLHGESRW